MTAQRSSRGGKVTHFIEEHLSLNELENRTTHEEFRGYFDKKDNVPPYPQPQFHVSHLKHETGPEGLRGISRDSGFRGSGDDDSEDKGLVWFNLAVGPEEIRSAEKKLLEEKFPHLPEEETSNNFLWKFATSPTFLKESLYGAFRFTLPLQEVLRVYSQKFCSGDPPVMRVYRTSVFKQEVQYIVLVHRPEHNERFSRYPPLEDQPRDAVCTYRDGHFIWNSQAMCQTHRYRMEVGEDQINAVPVNGRVMYYVWDVVSIALHLEPGEVLQLHQDQLVKFLTFCEKYDAPFMEKRKKHFKDFVDAKRLVEDELWTSAQLKKQTSLQEHFEEPVCKAEDPERAERR